jgi:hypothetical protein
MHRMISAWIIPCGAGESAMARAWQFSLSRVTSRSASGCTPPGSGSSISGFIHSAPQGSPRTSLATVKMTFTAPFLSATTSAVQPAPPFSVHGYRGHVDLGIITLRRIFSLGASLFASCGLGASSARRAMGCTVRFGLVAAAGASTFPFASGASAVSPLVATLLSVTNALTSPSWLKT